MNDKTQKALDRLEMWDDPREVLAWTESLKLGRSEPLHVGDEGVLLFIPNSHNYLIAAADEAAAVSLYARIPVHEQRCRVMLFSDAGHALACGYRREGIFCYRNCTYDLVEPIKLTRSLEIRQLAPADLDVVAAHYGMIPTGRILHHLEQGWIYGGFIGGSELVGFIGEHDEGSLGMLEVFPEHRRHGYARELQAAAINRMLEAGRVPYGQVVLGNDASFALQRSLGMSVLDGVQCWTEV